MVAAKAGTVRDTEARQRARAGLVRLADVMAQTSLTRSGIYTLRRLGLFPQPIRLGSLRCCAWSRVDIDRWVTDQIAQSRKRRAKAA